MACTRHNWASTQAGSRVTNQAVSAGAAEGAGAANAFRLPSATADACRRAGRVGVTVLGWVSFAAIHMRRTVECMIQSVKNPHRGIIMSIK
jgi:hypothetical protein